jgi:branched-chain amino acid transport system substrate-binding protein
VKKHCLAALIALSACAHAQAPGPLRIVATFGLSGPAADVGKELLAGTEFAIETVNRSGGVLGRQLTLDYQDNGTNPQRAVSQANALVAGAVLLMAPESASSTVAVSKTVSPKAKIPTCSSTSGADEVTMRDFQPYIFSLTPTSYMEAHAVAARLAKQPFKRYAILSADFAGGRASANRFMEFLKEMNPQAEIVAEEYPKWGSIDYTATINKILAAKPDYVYSILFGNDLITFSKQATNVGFFKQINNRFIALYDQGTLSALGDYAAIGTDGAQRSPATYFMNSGDGKAYVSAYRAKHGALPSDWATMAYDCVMAWSSAARAAKSVEADAVMNALVENKYASPRGTLSFARYDHQADVPVFLGKVARSAQLNQPIVDIDTVVPGAQVRPSEAVVKKSRMSE